MATSTNGNDGGPAFPGNPSMNIYTNLGMSLRDYFAAKSLQGLLAMGPETTEGKKVAIPTHAKVIADAAYSMADAMLKARGK